MKENDREIVEVYCTNSSWFLIKRGEYTVRKSSGEN